MKITICGSMQYIKGMGDAAKTLEKYGYEVELPTPHESETDYYSLPVADRVKLKDSLIPEHLDKITNSDAIFVYNKEKNGIAGYIGGNTLTEMAFAYTQNLEIFSLYPAPGLSYKDEIEGMKPIVLDGDLLAIDMYFQSLPKTLVSSKSPVKLRAVSRGLRKAGIRTQILPHPTKSNVAEQPQNIEETYEGAQNRHDSLRQETADQKPGFLATVESGLHTAHVDHNTFSSTVVVLEKVGSERKVGISLELEMPESMTDKVPSIYPDLGVLVQEEYGSTLKDPFPFFTGGKINRLQLVENAVFNVAAQFPEEKS